MALHISLVVALGIFLLQGIPPSSSQIANFTCKGKTISEAAPNVSVLVSRGGAMDFTVQIACFTKDGTAKEGTNYGASTSILSFPTSTMEKTLEIKLMPNGAIGPPNRTFYVSCLNYLYFNATINNRVVVDGSCENALVTVEDDDSEVAFCPDNEKTVWENATNYRLYFCRTGYLDFSAVIRISIDGDKADDIQYQAIANSQRNVTLTKQQSRIIVNISVKDDKIGEKTKRFNVTFSSSSSPTLTFKAPVTFTAAVVDDDIEFYFNSTTRSYNEGDGDLKVEVFRRGLTSVPGAVMVLFQPNSYCVGGQTNPVIELPAGKSHKEFVLCAILNDDQVETNQSFTVTLAGIQGSQVMPSKKTLTLNIIDNEVAIDCTGDAGYEESGMLSLKATRTGTASFQTAITCSSKNGTAKGGTDFVGFSDENLVFPAGGSNIMAMVISLIDDKAVGVNKTFQVSCVTSSPAKLYNCDNIQFKILEDDTYVFFCHAHETYIREASGSYNVSLCRVGVLNTVHTVQLCWTSDGNGLLHDYTSITANCANITFSYGDTRKQYKIDVKDDNWGEQEFKMFEISLKELSVIRNAFNVTFNGTANFSVTLHDDDNSFCGIKSKNFYEETDRYVNLTIKRWGELSSSNASVRVKIIPKEAQTPHDYEAPFSNEKVTFFTNETEKTVTIKIKNDNATEDNEQFNVMMVGVNGSTIFPECRDSLMNIISNDVNILCKKANMTFGPGVFENDSLITITFEREGSLQYNHTIRIQTVAGRAKPYQDYKPINEVRTFAENETLTEVNITLVNDLIVETNENFRVNVMSSDDRVNIMCPGIDLIIKNDDSFISCVNRSTNVTEGIKTAYFVLKREGFLGKEAKVWYQSQDGSAYQKADYKPIKKNYTTFSKGQAYMTLAFDIVNDDVHEETEDFSVMIGTDDPTIATGSMCGFNIIDDDKKYEDQSKKLEEQRKELEAQRKELEEQKKKVQEQKGYTTLLAVAIGVLCAVFLGVVVLVFLVWRKL